MQCQDIYPELMEDLQKLVASPMVTGLTVTKSRMESNFILAENEFPSTFLKALATSGVETKWAPTYILISSFELSTRLVSYSLYFVNISDIWISGWKTVFSIWWEAKAWKSGSRWMFYDTQAGNPFAGAAFWKSEGATCIYCQGAGEEPWPTLSSNFSSRPQVNTPIQLLRVNGRRECWRVWTQCAWSSVRASPSLAVRTSSRNLSVSQNPPPPPHRRTSI